MTDVARGTVAIDLDDRASAGLRKAEVEFERAMARMDGQRAEAKVGADLRELKRNLKEADAELAAWERKRAEASTTTEKRSTAASLANAKRRAQALRQETAELENQQRAIKNSNRERDYSLGKQQQQLKLEAAHARAADQTARSVQKQTAEHQRATRALSQQSAEVARLQQAHGKLQQSLANIEKARGRDKLTTPLHEKLQLDLDRNAITEKMRIIRGQLEAMNAKPIEIHAEVEEPSTLRMWAQQLGSTTVRVGPFTTSIIGLARSLMLLGPIVVGVAGSVGALGSALGAGVAGAAGVAAAGVAGFALAAGGLFFALRPAVKSLGEAFKASTAYNTAVDKYGKNSKQAATAQKQLNNVLGAVPPETRKQFESLGKLNDQWKKLTEPTRTRFFKTAGEGIKTVGALMPQLAARTNQAAGAIGDGLDKAFQGMRSDRGKQMIDNIQKGFNAAIPNLMGGILNLGHAFGNIAQDFAPQLKPLTAGFKSFSASIVSATNPSKRMAGTVKSLVGAMQSIGHVTAAAGRVLLAFGRAGMGPGTDMIEKMAAGLNKLAGTMNTIGGQKKLGKFFGDSIDTTTRLYGALKPLAQLFIEFSTILRPFTNVALSIVGPMASLLHTLLAFAPIKGVITAAFAAFFAGTIINRVYSAANAVKTLYEAFIKLREAQGVGAALKAAFGGNLAAEGARAAAETGGAAAETEQAAASGRATAANNALAASNERVAASAEAVAVASQEAAAAEGEQAVAAEAGAAASAEKSVANVGEGAAAAEAGAAGLAGTLSTVTLGLTLAAAAGYLFYKNMQSALESTTDETKNLGTTNKAIRQATANHAALGSQLTRTGLSQAQATLTLKQAKQQLDATRKGTDDHKQALINYRQALIDQQDAEKQGNDLRRRYQGDTNRDLLRTRGALMLAQEKAAEDHNSADSLAAVASAQRAVEQASNRAAVASLNAGRSMRGMAILGGQAEQALGKLARQTKGSSLEKKISLKFEQPKDVSRVAATASRALQAGVPQRVVTNIVANSKSAEAAIKRINGLIRDIKDKNVVIRSATASATGAAIAKVARAVAGLTGKNVNLRAHDAASGPARTAKSNIDKIPGVHNTHLKANDGASGPSRTAKKNIAAIPGAHSTALRAHDQVTGAARAAKAAIDAIPLLHTTVIATRRTNEGTGAATHAAGGAITPSEKRAEAAMARQAQRTTGGRYNGAAYIVGEENRPEFVIATNPAYRDQNVRYWMNAGSALGVLPDSVRKNVQEAQDTLHGVPMHKTGKDPSAKKKRAATKSKKQTAAKEKRKSYEEGVKSAKHDITHSRHEQGVQDKADAFYTKDYGAGGVRNSLWQVAFLEQQEDLLRQSISYEEGNLAEPDTFLRDTGQKTGTGDPILEVDQGAVNGWASQLTAIAGMYEQLVRILEALNNQIAQTVMEVNDAMADAALQKKVAEDHQHQLENVLLVRKKGQRMLSLTTNADNGILDKIELEKERASAYGEVISELSDDKETLLTKGRDIEASGGRRDIAERTRDHYSAEANSVLALAQKELSTSTASAAGGGGGGAGGTNPTSDLTYGQQSAAADGAIRAAAQSFGGNAVAPLADALGSVGSPGGMVANPSAGGGPLMGSLSMPSPMANSAAVSSLGGASSAALVASAVGGVMGGRPHSGAAGVGGIAPGIAGGGVGGTNVTVNNRFDAPPPDPHTWSKGVQFELGAAI